MRLLLVILRYCRSFSGTLEVVLVAENAPVGVYNILGAWHYPLDAMCQN